MYIQITWNYNVIINNYTNCICTYKSHEIIMCFPWLKWHTHNSRTSFKVLRFCTFASHLINPNCINKNGYKHPRFYFSSQDYKLVNKHYQCLLKILDKYIVSSIQDSLFHLKDQKNDVFWSTIVLKTGSSHKKITQFLRKKVLQYISLIIQISYLLPKKLIQKQKSSTVLKLSSFNMKWWGSDR